MLLLEKAFVSICTWLDLSADLSSQKSIGEGDGSENPGIFSSMPDP